MQGIIIMDLLRNYFYKVAMRNIFTVSFDENQTLSIMKAKLKIVFEGYF